MRRSRTAGLLLLLLLVAAACGQKAGVGDSVAAGGGFGTSESGGGETSDLGDGSGSSDGLEPGTGDATGDTVAPGEPSGGDAAGETTGGGGATATTAAPSGGAPPAGDRTGISDKVIKIGIHAPLTGAAPVPTEAFRRGLPIYWNFVKKSEGGVFGREVQVAFRDDEFNPSTAVRVCREMVEQEKVFLLFGVAGADQISACAKYANSVGVPYISAGVNQEGLTTLRGYFAGSQTYLQQSPILAQLAKKITGNNKFAVVIENTPTFRESKVSIETQAKQVGLDVVLSKFISKGASQAEILTTSNDLRGSGADVVYFLGPPTIFIPLAQQGQSQGYVPAYVGPGLSQGLNLVAAAGCPGISKSKFLSPFPQLDAIDRLDPNYKKEYRQQEGQEGDDLGIGLWGLNKGLHQFFKAAGKDMTRQSFVQTLESGREFFGNVFPKVQYNARNHFGADSSHLLAADCNSRTWRTEATFVKGF